MAYRNGAAAFKAGRAARDNIILGKEFNWVGIEDLKARPIEIEVIGPRPASAEF